MQNPTSAPMPRLSALHVYPVKSCAAWSPAEAELRPRGLAHDRRWLVVDAANGRFLTGREVPALVRLHATPADGGLVLVADGRAPLTVPLPEADAPRLAVTIWKDDVEAACADAVADAWLSEWLGRDVRLVRMDARASRTVGGAAAPGVPVSFADALPLLAIGRAALDGLNARIGRALPMARFRPNLVIDGIEAHAEDRWHRVRIGEVELDAVKPCVRCVFTTIDPVTGERDADGEPLRTLKTYRRSERGITFGVNLVPRTLGTLRVGDAVQVLD